MGQYNSIIEDGLLIAKWNNDTERRDLAALYLDIYRGNYRQILKALIKEQCDHRLAKALYCFLESEEICSRLIEEISLVFSEPSQITLMKRKGKGKNEEIVINEELNPKFQELLEAVDLNVVLENIDKYTELMYDVPVLPQHRNGDIKIDIITSDKCYVEQNELDPTLFDRFIYQVDILENTKKINEIVKVNYWDITEGKAKKFKADVLMNGEIDPKTVEEIKGVPNYKKEMPVTIFRNYYPDDSVFYKGSSGIIDKSIMADLRRTDLCLTEAYEIAQMVTKGMEKDDFNELKIARIFRINIPASGLEGGETGDASYISPNSQLKELLELVKDRYKSLALSRGISMSQISGESASSGFHLALSMSKIIDRNKRKRKYYTKPLKKLLRMLLITANAVKFANFPDHPLFRIDYGELEFAMSDEDREKLFGLQKANGTRNLIDYEMDRNPDIKTREEALEIVLARREENEKLKPPNPFEGVPPIDDKDKKKEKEDK